MSTTYDAIRVWLARNSDEMGGHGRMRMPNEYVVWWEGDGDMVALSPALQRIVQMPDDERPDFIVLDDAGEELEPALRVLA
jgi:hypothetical protein